MNKSVISKLLLAKRLYGLAKQALESSNDLSLCIGVNLIQDSIEAFLLAVSEQVNAGIGPNTKFEQYFDLINSKISPKELPFRSKLSAINKLRVNSKHYGLAPAQSEINGISITVREFFDEVTSSVIGLSFGTISLIDLLRDGEAKKLLREAEKAFQDEDYEECLIACRKAIYVRIETWYDISSAGDPPKGLVGMGAFFMCKAPYYAKNKKYIEESVKSPTDYIVLDHNVLEMDLMKSGMDSLSFWNVWRLTPAMFRHKDERGWVVKREFGKLDPEGIKERAEYVLDTTISLLVAEDQRLASARVPASQRYYVDLKREEVPVYSKADKRSEITNTTPPGLTRLNVDFAVDGLSDDDLFWHVQHFGDSAYLSGFICAEDVKSSEK